MIKRHIDVTKIHHTFMDKSVAAYVRAAVSDIYVRYLVGAAEAVGYKIKTTPNNKFTVLIAGVSNSGKTEFMKRLLRLKNVS